MAAVGGIILASRLRSVDTNAGGGSILLYSIAAAVIGGTSLFGGRGHIKSALLGALVIASIDNGLGLLGLGSGEKFVITGGVLLLAVTVDSVSRRRQAQAGTLIAALFVTGASKGVGRRRRPALRRRGLARGVRLAQRRRPRARGRARAGLRRARPGAGGRRGRRRGRASSAASTPSWRTPAWARTGRSSSSTPEQVDEMIDVNLKGTLYTARATLPHLIESQGRLPLARLGGGAARLPGRDGLQRVEVRPARLHALARPRDARARACA